MTCRARAVVLVVAAAIGLPSLPLAAADGGGHISVEPGASIDFGYVPTEGGDGMGVFVHAETADLVVTRLGMVSDKRWFIVTPNACNGAALSRGEQCDAGIVTFGREPGGVYEDVLRVDYEVDGQPHVHDIPVRMTTGTLPSAPQNGSVVRGPGELSCTVQWDAAEPGDRPVTSYEIYASPVGTWTRQRLELPADGATRYSAHVTQLSRERHRVWVAGVSEIGTGAGFAGECEPQVAPTDVRDLTAAPGPDSVTVSWQPPADNGDVQDGRPLDDGAGLTYELLREPAFPGGTSRTTSEPFLVDDDAPRDGPFSEYSYQVRAVNAVAPGPWTSTTAVVPLSTPAAPTAVEVFRGPGPGEATVTFTPGDDGGLPVRYEVHRRSDAGAAVLTTTGTSVTDGGMPPGAVAHYRVIATNELGGSASSDEVSVRVMDVPGQPVDGEGSAATQPLRVALAWRAPADDGGSPITAYTVLRDDGTLVRVSASTPRDAQGRLTFTDTAVTAGNRYSYEVRAESAVGLSEPLLLAVTTPAGPSAPQSASASVDVDATRVRWTPPTTDGGVPVTGYIVLRSTRGGTLDPIARLSADARVFADRTRVLGGQHRYAVVAVNAVGPGTVAAVTPTGVLSPLF